MRRARGLPICIDKHSQRPSAGAQNHMPLWAGGRTGLRHAMTCQDKQGGEGYGDYGLRLSHRGENIGIGRMKGKATKRNSPANKAGL